MTDLKDEASEKIDRRFNELKIEFLTKIKEQIKNGFTVTINNRKQKLKKLDPTVAVLQEHAKENQGQMSDQCGWRLYLRIERAPLVETETSKKILDKVNFFITESCWDIGKVVMDGT